METRTSPEGLTCDPYAPNPTSEDRLERRDPSPKSSLGCRGPSPDQRRQFRRNICCSRKNIVYPSNPGISGILGLGYRSDRRGGCLPECRIGGGSLHGGASWSID